MTAWWTRLCPKPQHRAGLDPPQVGSVPTNRAPAAARTHFFDFLLLVDFLVARVQALASLGLVHASDAWCGQSLAVVVVAAPLP